MKIRVFGLLLISTLPFNIIRIFSYKIFFKYDIDYSSKIGLFNYIDCKECHLHGATIGSFNFLLVKTLDMQKKSIIKSLNKFSSLNKVSIGTNSVIMKKNRFVGTKEGTTPFKSKENFIIGEDGGVLYENYFDLSDSIVLGDNVVFAGLGHKVWTHGFSLKRVKIQSSVSIKNNVYFGSDCIVLPGVKICSNVEVGAGTVVSKDIQESGFYISSQLLKKSKLHTYTNEEITEFNNAKFHLKVENVI